MPLRDHFENPARRTWERVHGGWPAVIAQHLYPVLPARYHVAPQVHLGQFFRMGIAPSEPTLTLEKDPPEPDEYEVRIYDAEEGQRLVAAVELVSPSNKDRPESRRAFVAKCAALLQQDVCVSIVDLVTVRQFNLYADVLELLGRSDPAMGPTPPPLYAVTIHRQNHRPRWRLKTWAHALRVGQPLPSLPVWLNDRDGTMLDLEATYEETCRTLRVA